MKRSAAFPLFASLPPEIRNLIWEYSLPQAIPARLSFLKPGSLRTDRGWVDERAILDAMEVKLPSAFVNKEARGITITWVRKHGLKMRCYEGMKYPIFIRPFDNESDALYISIDEYSSSFMNVDDTQLNVGHGILTLPNGQGRNVKSVVVPKSFFLDRGDKIVKLLKWFACRQILLITNRVMIRGRSKTKTPFEIVNTGKGCVRWNARSQQFAYGYGRYIGEAKHYRKLGHFLSENDAPSFKIQPVMIFSRN